MDAGLLRQFRTMSNGVRQHSYVNWRGWGRIMVIGACGCNGVLITSDASQDVIMDVLMAADGPTEVHPPATICEDDAGILHADGGSCSGVDGADPFPCAAGCTCTTFGQGNAVTCYCKLLYECYTVNCATINCGQGCHCADWDRSSCVCP